MRRILPLMLLAACAAPQGTPPGLQTVKLTDRALELRLSDGTLCRADWRAAPVGRMDGCGAGYGYAVTVEDSPNLARQLVEGVFLALGAEGVLAPMAEVVITEPGGTDRVYVSPPPRG